MKFTTYLFSIIIVMFWVTQSQAQLPFPLPASQNTSTFGKNIQRTMDLLQSSTPAKRNTVKILVYGQSISEQTWSDSVKTFLNTTYPNANIIMINRAIGAFASQLLKKPMYFDINTFYPDLILFHVYGSHYDLDSIMNNIRRNTTAEVLIQNSHVTIGDSSSGSWENTYGYTHIPNIAMKYGLEYADIRTPWYKYLADNGLRARQLTGDEVHLNQQGNFLLARLLERYLFRNTAYATDSLKTVKTLSVGTDIQWENGKLVVPFFGNKIEIVADVAGGNTAVADVKIDGMSPSSFPGVYMVTRPNVPYNYDWKNGWPWNTAGPVRISNQVPLLEETWTMTITGYSQDGSGNKTINFSLSGSLTGADGSGTARFVKNDGYKSSSPGFISNSRRVVINPDDWFGYLDISNPYAVGHKITWKVKKFATDTYQAPASINNPAIDSVVVLAQGIPNKNHVLVISTSGINVPIKAIRVYSPILKRENVKVLSSNNTLCYGKTFDLTETIRDINSVAGTIKFYKNSQMTIPVVSPQSVTAPGVYFARKDSVLDPMTFTTTLIGNNCPPRLGVTNPPCSATSVDITTAFVDSANTNGTVYFLKNVDDFAIIENPEKITVSGTYFIYKETDSLVVDYKPVQVSVGASCITSTDRFSSNDFNLFPNPSQGIITVTHLKHDVIIHISDLIGNTIFTDHVKDEQGSKSYDFSHYPKGVYFIQMKNNTGITTKRFVLE